MAPRLALVLVVAGATACGSRYYSSDAPDAAASDGGADAASAEAGSADDASTPEAGIDAGADVDSGRVFSGCNGLPACDRTVFVTKSAFDGKLGGLAGADAKCQAAADASPLTSVQGKRFLAWISDNVDGPLTRFPQGTGKYLTTNGSVIATGLSDLRDGALSSPLAFDETGTMSTAPHAWTAVSGVGGAVGFDCEKWTTALNNGSELGNVGVPSAVDSHWTQDVAIGCGNAYPLYCFEY